MKICEQWSDFKFLFYDTFLFVCLLATVAVWRGVWNVLEFYVGEFF